MAKKRQRQQPLVVQRTDDLLDSLTAPKPPVEQAQVPPPPGRKKRKDAIGRKSDYHQGTGMIGVRLPDEVIEEIREIVKKEGITVNAWLKALILNHLEKDE